jgi:hypothetical protein
VYVVYWAIQLTVKLVIGAYPARVHVFAHAHPFVSCLHVILVWHPITPR